jgi:uncharacterized protein (TIGR02266 family)
MNKDRRREVRLPIQMWVEESTEHELYFQHSANLSSGGMFLERTIPHPVGTIVTLQFTLPGDDAPIRVRSQIVHASSGAADSDELGVHLKFLDLDAKTAERIGRYIKEHGTR